MNKIVAAVKRKGLPFEFVEYMGMNGVIKAVRVNYTGLRPPLIKGAVVINHNVYNESMTLVTEYGKQKEENQDNNLHCNYSVFFHCNDRILHTVEKGRYRYNRLF